MAKNITQFAGKAQNQLESILILTDLAKIGIENEALNSYKDLYLFFNVINLLSLRGLNNLKKTQS